MSDRDTNLRLFLDHRAALVDYATPIVGNRANAEDVVQEAYLRFSVAGERNVLEQPLAYLYRVVRNHALDMARRLASEKRRGPGAAVINLPEIADLAANPEKVAMQRDDLRRVAAALDALPARTRHAFELYRFHERTLQQIAGELGISTTMAHKLVRQAMVACMSELGDDHAG